MAAIMNCLKSFSENSIPCNQRATRNMLSNTHKLKNRICKKKLTFGIEFEFALMTLSPSATDPHPKDGRQVYDLDKEDPSYELIEIISNNNIYWDGQSIKEARLHAHIANTLRKAGIQAMTSIELWNASCKARYNGTTIPQEHEFWMVTKDVSVSPHEQLEDIYNFCPIEVKSPAYRASKTAFAVVAKVCDILASNYRLNCSRSSGLHVHVGDGAKGFSDGTVGRLLALQWVFEPQLQQMHPDHRLENQFCSSLRRQSNLSRLARYFEQRETERLQVLLRASSVTELEFLMMSPTVRPCIDISNLKKQREADCKKTIEFRQHEGTLDPQRVLNWTKFCVAMVEYARDAHWRRDMSFKKWLLKNCDPLAGHKVLSVVDVIEEIGGCQLADYYGMKVDEGYKMFKGPLDPEVTVGSESYFEGSRDDGAKDDD